MNFYHVPDTIIQAPFLRFRRTKYPYDFFPGQLTNPVTCTKHVNTAEITKKKANENAENENDRYLFLMICFNAVGAKYNFRYLTKVLDYLEPNLLCVNRVSKNLEKERVAQPFN